MLLEKFVHLQRMILIPPIHHHQVVELHPMLPEQPHPPHHRLERRLAFLIHPISVMQMFRPVDREADQKIMPLKKPAPLVIQQRPIGLKGILDRLPIRILLLIGHDALEEFHAHQRRLAPLPGKGDLRHILGRNILLHIPLQHVLRHPPIRFVRIQLLLFQVKTIFAIQIANRPDGLGHHMEGGG